MTLLSIDPICQPTSSILPGPPCSAQQRLLLAGCDTRNAFRVSEGKKRWEGEHSARCMPVVQKVPPAGVRQGNVHVLPEAAARGPSRGRGPCAAVRPQVHRPQLHDPRQPHHHHRPHLLQGTAPPPPTPPRPGQCVWQLERRSFSCWSGACGGQGRPVPAMDCIACLMAARSGLDERAGGCASVALPLRDLYAVGRKAGCAGTVHEKCKTVLVRIISSSVKGCRVSSAHKRQGGRLPAARIPDRPCSGNGEPGSKQAHGSM